MHERRHIPVILIAALVAAALLSAAVYSALFARSNYTVAHATVLIVSENDRGARLAADAAHALVALAHEPAVRSLWLADVAQSGAPAPSAEVQRSTQYTVIAPGVVRIRVRGPYAVRWAQSAAYSMRAAVAQYYGDALRVEVLSAVAVPRIGMWLRVRDYAISAAIAVALTAVIFTGVFGVFVRYAQRGHRHVSHASLDLQSARSAVVSDNYMHGRFGAAEHPAGDDAYFRYDAALDETLSRDDDIDANMTRDVADVARGTDSATEDVHMRASEESVLPPEGEGVRPTRSAATHFASDLRDGVASDVPRESDGDGDANELATQPDHSATQRNAVSGERASVSDSSGVAVGTQRIRAALAQARDAVRTHAADAGAKIAHVTSATVARVTKKDAASNDEGGAVVRGGKAPSEVARKVAAPPANLPVASSAAVAEETASAQQDEAGPAAGAPDSDAVRRKLNELLRGVPPA